MYSIQKCGSKSILRCFYQTITQTGVVIYIHLNMKSVDKI